MTVRPDVLQYRDLIVSAVEGTPLDPALVAALVDEESRGVPTALNPSGAAGLTQVKPAVHRDLVARVAGLPPNASDAELTEALFRPEIAIEAGVLILSWCVRHCGDEAKGLSKYHVGSCVAGSKKDSKGTATKDYVAAVMSLRDEYRQHFGSEKETPVPIPIPPVLPPIVVTPRAITFGRVPHPPFVDAIVAKPAGDGQGHTVVPPRTNVGTCVHFWGGDAWTNPAWKSIHGLFAGERLWDALTDYSVQRDGTIVRLNDPRGTRSPYASGGSDRLAGDGPAFVRTFGPGAVNSKLVSIETEGNGGPMTPPQVESLSALVAYWSDDAGISWEAFPLHPKHGIVTQLQHFETGKAGCPGGGVRGQTDAYQDRSRAIMRQYQTGASPTPPVPPPSPVTPVVPYSAAADVVFLTERFGTAVKHDADGAIIGQATYDPAGIISNAWVQRCDAEDVWPSATSWMTGLTGAVKQRVRFKNGWALNDLGNKQGWLWAGREGTV